MQMIKSARTQKQKSFSAACEALTYLEAAATANAKAGLLLRSG
jgi:hypothetical protein